MLIHAKDLRMENTPELARWLLGKSLVLRTADGSLLRAQITETEAYHGHEDRASHASRGRTARNAPMFEAGGIWYVYLCYGVHEMLNLVTGPKHFPAAILIRGVAGYSGPGRLTRSLGIDRRFNAMPAARSSGLWLEDEDVVVAENQIRALPRVGVGYAGEFWAAKSWRFVWTPSLSPGG